MTKTIKLIILVSVILIATSCKQGYSLFNPIVLPADYTFSFNQPYKEYFFQVDKRTKINGLLFRTDSASKGLIFYLHGNSGSIQSTGIVADVYLRNGYDFFILDYRGFGKSQGKIRNEKKIYHDIHFVYDSIKKLYNEQNIIILGYSIGTGFATELASTNNPKLLILQAPYYNLPDLVHQHINVIPSIFIKYRFKTNEYITKVKSPITIFHGSNDELILVEASYKLQKLLKPGDKLIILEGHKHNRINENLVFLQEINKLLK